MGNTWLNELKPWGRKKECYSITTRLSICNVHSGHIMKTGGVGRLIGNCCMILKEGEGDITLGLV